MEPIGCVKTDFPSKFGVPRQSGLAKGVKGEVRFLPEYGVADAFRGLEGFSHIWIIWEFSESVGKEFSPLIRPPRLGGEKKVGVFASRSSFRPNNLALSCVKLDKIGRDENGGTVLYIDGVDMMDNSPVYDVKPYLPISDCRPEATSGFAEETKDYALKVNFPEELEALIPKEKREALRLVLAEDPRPAYHSAADRKYGVAFCGYDVRFYVDRGVLSVAEVEKL